MNCDTDDAFINAVGIIGHGTSRQVSKLIGCSMSLAQNRLKKLESDGSIDGELIGNSWVYRKCEQ